MLLITLSFIDTPLSSEIDAFAAFRQLSLPRRCRLLI